jgi:2-aminoadipate transaminase
VTTIPFTRGVPDASLLPIDDLRHAAGEAFELDAAGVLSYAVGGYRPLREWIAGRHGVDPYRVLVVNGSLQGVAFLAQHLFLGVAGRALVEDPTYDRTLVLLRTFGAEVAGIALGQDGIDVDELERQLDTAPAPRLLYSIPTFQNPSGVTLPVASRRRVVEACRERGVLVVEDDPYGLLRFEGEAQPTMLELDGGDNVVYSSSFTKTVAPGLRTGYLILPERLVAPLQRISENTVIGPNTLAEATLAAYCSAGRFEPNVRRAGEALRARRDIMALALREHFPAGARWTTPQGGYFFWVDLPDSLDTGELLAEATSLGVPYVKGSDFSCSGGCRSSLRLAYSAVAQQQISEGVARLGALLSQQPAPAPA